MKSLLLTVLILFSSCLISYGQKNLEQISDSILNEAFKIYELEKSAWVSTDFLLNIYPKRYFRKEIEGYLSYKDNYTIKTIYWQEQKDGIVINNTFSFNNPEQISDFEHTHMQRLPTKKELKLINIRNKVVADIESDLQFYTIPTGAKFNIVVIENDNQYRSYLLVGFNKKNVVPLGNDYCIELDTLGKIINRKRLHKSYIETPFNGGIRFKGQKIKAIYHSHLPGTPFITSTDICIAMLFADFIEWKEITIVSSDYLSTYNISDKTLKIELYESEK
nr:hypothetical protein [Bacteroidota bacterium]